MLLFMSIFWSVFNLVLSFIHVGNSASCPPAGCKIDPKTFCSTVANGQQSRPDLLPPCEYLILIRPSCPPPPLVQCPWF
jgi:hypothetical protein